MSGTKFRAKVFEAKVFEAAQRFKNGDHPDEEQRARKLEINNQPMHMTGNMNIAFGYEALLADTSDKSGVEFYYIHAHGKDILQIRPKKHAPDKDNTQ